MSVIRTLTGNYIINVGFTSWFLAQVLKTLFTLFLTRKLVLERLVGAGGMPSAHAALTSSIVIGMARKVGPTSPEFGLSIAFAAVVMYDAMGVRRAAGEQAKVLNRMIFEFPVFHQRRDEPRTQETLEDKDEAVPCSEPGLESGLDSGFPLLGKELKEFLGHTPMEVLGGCLLGILVAMFMPVR